jgi:hypothetical protein
MDTYFNFDLGKKTENFPLLFYGTIIICSWLMTYAIVEVHFVGCSVG